MAQKRAGDEVYAMIRQRILNREWQPGMKIMSESQLVKEFGVSRVSVREAIEKLVALGVLEKVQGGGTFVREVNNTEFVNDLLPLLTLEYNNYKEVLEFRQVFEPACTRMCAERGDPCVFARLQALYEAMCAHEHDHKAFTAADAEFHLTIAEGSGNALLHKMYEVFMPVLTLHHRSLYTSLKWKGGVSDHKRLLDVLLARDGELSELYARRHVQRTMREMTEQHGDAG